MAHLLVHPSSCSALWESIYSAPPSADRPAALDNTEGIAHSKLTDAQAILSVGNTIKEDLDLSMCTVQHVGIEVKLIHVVLVYLIF